MMKKRTTLAISVAVGLSILAGCSADGTDSSGEVVAAGENIVVANDTVGSDAVAINVEDNAETHSGAADYNESDVVEISLGSVISADSDAVRIDGTSATITAAGTYRLSGTISDGQLTVDAGDDAIVQLILDEANITNTDGAAVAIMSAETAIVILTDGSVNTLTDGAVYTLAADEDEPNAALYSKSDLTIAGSGSLVVYGNYNDGIASKDGLVIDGGDITVAAVDDGIRGKDYVVVNDGTLDVTAGGDGIKSDNEEDADKGFISMAAGSLSVTAGGDAIQAVTDVLITGGDFFISAGGGSASSLAADQSAKAIKGAASVVIEGGAFVIDSADDAVHSNTSVVINAGSFEIATGDDAVHADDTVEVNGGTISITKSYEGIEGATVTINGGDIQIIAADDGLNVAGGVDGSGEFAATGDPSQDTFRPGPGGGPGGGMPEEVPGDYYLYINGGSVVIDAYGDGIDSNGYVYMTGGTVIINGSTSTRDSALDHNGTFDMSGGTLIGTNVDGMMSEGIDAGTQASIYVTTGTVYPTGTVIHIESGDGDSVLTFEAGESFSVIVFSSPDLVVGETYDIYLEGTADGDSLHGLYEAGAYSPGTLAETTTAS
jgi:hypothetical protein